MWACFLPCSSRIYTGISGLGGRYLPVHSYLPLPGQDFSVVNAFYAISISLKTLYLSITFILIYILEAQCTHTGDPYCTHNIVFYPYFYYFNLIQFYFRTYLFIFITHLFIILLVPIIALAVFLRIVFLYT